MNIKTLLVLVILVYATSCKPDDETQQNKYSVTFRFTHHWNGTPVTQEDFNTIQYTNAKGNMLSIERLRYVISDITFTTPTNEKLVLDIYNLVDVTDHNSLSYNPSIRVPAENYTNVSFKFGLDNEDNYENNIDLNSKSFNVPDVLGGGYHYMQLDGKFINSNSITQGFNYHAIRAVDNPGDTPTFPQDTFFVVNLGSVNITNHIEIEVQMNIAKWFNSPNIWDLNTLNQMLMPNSSAQIMMYENGKNVFSLGELTQ